MQHPEHFHPSAADSAGQPWAGRTFEDNRFSRDDGTMPPAVADAVTRFREALADRDSEHPIEVRAGEELVDTLRTSRALIPLVAELGEAGENERGQTVDKSADLSIVTVAGPDGRRVLPVFTSTEAMRRWNPDARPVPVDMRTAALAAADDHTELMVVDPGSESEFGLRRPAVWAVAQDIPWVAGYRNEHVARALGEGIAEEDAIRAMELAPAAPPGSLDGPELIVTLVVDPGLDAGQIEQLIARVSGRWAQSPEVVSEVDSLTVRVSATGRAEPALRSANGTADAGPRPGTSGDPAAAAAAAPAPARPAKRGIISRLFGRDPGKSVGG